MEWVALVDEHGVLVPILDSAPGADTGQPAVPVRVISSLAGGGGGGGVVQQGARDVTAQGWNVRTTGADVVVVGDGAGSLTVDDGAGSLTVDAPVGTPAFVELSDGVMAMIGQRVMAGSLPVVVASDQSALKAREDTAAMTWASAVATAPAANSVQATTGALAAGDYDFDVQLGCQCSVTAGKCLLLEHRNAADAATLFTLALVGPNGSVQVRLRRYTIAANERLRVIVGAVAFAASERAQSAIGRRTS